MSIANALQPGAPLHALARYAQFMLYRLVPNPKKPGKMTKLPVSPHTLESPVAATDPANWADCNSALAALQLCGEGYGLAFVFTDADPFWFLDIDDCRDGAGWSALALELLGAVPGAAIEVSSSGSGLHAFFSGPVVPHACKDVARRLELYHTGRFVALTGNCGQGGSADAAVDVAALVARYFPAASRGSGAAIVGWTAEPRADWRGPIDDAELLQRMLGARKSVAAAMGRRATPAQLWAADADALAAAFPADGGGFDASSADLALAQHLAFWTGCDCARMERLMRQSGLAREKWDAREDYLERTILRAAGLQGAVLGSDEREPVRAAEWTTESLARFPSGVSPVDAVTGLVKNPESAFAQAWNASDLRGMLPTLAWRLEGNCEAVLEAVLLRKEIPDTPDLRQAIADACARADRFSTSGRGDGHGGAASAEPTELPGTLIMQAEDQLAHFRGCVYVRGLNQVLMPTGELYDKATFDVVMGPYHFVTGKNAKPSKSAWEAFLYSQWLRHPQADYVAFRPDLVPGLVFSKEGRVAVNGFVPIPIERTPGDVAPFLAHVAKLVPVAGDREILLAYLAAVVQYPGVKFRWAPVLQGCEGNGKGVFETILRGALGMRYVHTAQAGDIDNKFNAWILGKLLICVNEINTGGKADVIDALKPMVSDPVLGIQGKGADQTSAEVCANFFFTTNRKGAMGKAAEGRRYSIFHTAQQSKADLSRDGLTGAYFVRLNRWLANGGQAALNHWLSTYPIPAHLNPAGECQTAPETSSYGAAVADGRGSVEQEILEAIESEQIGFRGGFVSGYHLAALIKNLHKGAQVAPAKRRELMQSLGYDWHPALREGRSTVAIAMDGGSKSVIFVRKGSPLENLQTGRDVADNYEKLQTGGNFLKVVN